MKMNKKGFTLVELMVVVIIVGILAAVAVPLMSANKDKAIGTELQAAAGSIATAAKLYYTQESTNPLTVQDLVDKEFLTSDDLTGSYFAQADYVGFAGFSGKGKISNGATITANGLTITFDGTKWNTTGTYTAPTP